MGAGKPLAGQVRGCEGHPEDTQARRGLAGGHISHGQRGAVETRTEEVKE